MWKTKNYIEKRYILLPSKGDTILQPLTFEMELIILNKIENTNERVLAKTLSSI